MNPCHVCDAIARNPELSNVRLGDLTGTTEATIRRHKRNPHQEIPDDFFEDIPNSIVTSRGKSIRREDGSWEKITYRPQDLAAQQAMTYSDVADRLDKFVGASVSPDPQTHHTRFVCVADPQIGKTQSGGGTVQTVERAMRIMQRVAADTEAKGYAELVYVDLGDILEGFGNVHSQAQTNDLSMTDQFRVARRLLLDGLLMFAPLAPAMTFVSVSSNHCQVRGGLGDKMRSNFPGDDWGLLIHDTIMSEVNQVPSLEHIKSVTTGKYEEAVTVTTQDGTVVGLTHGHLANRQDKIGEWFKGQSHGRRSNLNNADVLAFGHFHSPYIGVSGDGRYVLGAPSLDTGSDWYANKTGETNAPGMMTFDVVGGHLADWRIWTDDKIA